MTHANDTTAAAATILTALASCVDGLTAKDIAASVSLPKTVVGHALKLLMKDGDVESFKNGTTAKKYRVLAIDVDDAADASCSIDADDAAILAAEGMKVDDYDTAETTDDAAAPKKTRRANVAGIVKTVCNVISDDADLVDALRRALVSAGHEPGAQVRKGLQRALDQHGTSLGDGGTAAVKVLIDEQPSTSPAGGGGGGGTGGGRIKAGESRIVMFKGMNGGEGSHCLQIRMLDAAIGGVVAKGDAWT